MANGKSDEDIANQAAKEARADERKKNEIDAKEKALSEANRGKRFYKTALEQATSSLNTTQVVVGLTLSAGGVFAGYWLNQFLRKKTAEWEWVNDEGERSIGSILIADVALPVLGVGLAGLTGWLFRRKGAVAAACVGLFMGLAVGSVLSSALGPD